MDRGREVIDHNEKIFDLWRDAYPGIPEVEDVKKRLAGLKGKVNEDR